MFFFAKKWNGQPRETEEMFPKWFKFEDIPFEKMWDDDKYWLEGVLNGKKIKADFVFKQGEKIYKYNIKTV